MSEPNIVFTRVDNRLVHGQVGNVWATTISTNLIVVVDDEVSEDTFQQSLMKMTADAVGIAIRFFSIQKTIDVIHNAASTQKIFIVAKTPEVVLKLVEAGVPIKQCDIGNMHQTGNKRVFHDSHVYVDDKDVEDINKLKEHGVEVFIQITPNDKKHKV